MLLLRDCPYCLTRNRVARKTCWKCGYRFDDYVPVQMQSPLTVMDRWDAVIRTIDKLKKS